MYPLQGQFEFDARRRQALWKALRAVLQGRSRTLLSYDEVIRAAGREGQVDRGVRDIPLDMVRGSEGRAAEFDASFRPVRRELRARWARMDELMLQGVAMPPVEVYQLGALYFVKDGHHRVSVARHLGWESIPAHVIEVRTRAPVDGAGEAFDLLRTAEYADFLARTRLDHERPDARVECNQLGRYDLIFSHILGHRYFLGLENGREASMEEAAASWYDNVFMPVMAVLREHHVADRLPDLSSGDLYLAVTRRWLEMAETDLPGGADAAAAALAARGEEEARGLSAATRRWARGLRRRVVRV